MAGIQKILLVGKFAADSSIYTYTASFNRVLQQLGYTVVTFNYARHFFQGYCSKLNDFITNYLLARKIQYFKPDLIFLLKAETIWSSTIQKCKRANNKIINFYPDNPFVFWNGNASRNVLEALPLYDSFLIWSKMLIPALKSAGCKNVSYLPFIYEAAQFSKDIPINEADINFFSSDVCFVGTWDLERENWLSNLIEKMPNLHVAIWGNRWSKYLKKGSALRSCLKGNAVYGDQLLKAYRCSKIVLNFIRRQNMTAHNMRTIEVPASKSFLLTERTYEQAKELFKEGENIACFSSLEELVNKITFYLCHAHERKKIIEKGYERVQRYRMDIVLEDVINSIAKKRSLWQ